MSKQQSNILFEDTFDVRALNENGRKFERVDRLSCKGTTYDVDTIVDVNRELLVVRPNDRLNLALASTLRVDGAPDDGKYRPLSQEANLSDSYDYVMHGRVYSIKQDENQNLEIQASFGGLLFRLRGEQAQLSKFVMDQMFYLLIIHRKTEDDL
jgi:DNA-directed RNA polymerases I, II, and III subunit RPABC3